MKFDFKNKEGITLTGNLEMPNSEPKAFAIFAHCFTCSKSFSATTTISRELARLGVATLRFDFTGIGRSEGDFADTNFSSNVEDLLSAFNVLKEKYQTPSILIGHSLGGAAVLKASTFLEEIKAVVTIGAPSSTEHVSHLFQSALCEIEEKGEAVVNLAGREFKIKDQFLKDIKETQLLTDLAKQRKAYLIMHAPLDDTVSVKHAENIFKSLRHPKSFVSLDKADHLLTNKEDSKYVAGIINAWASRYLSKSEN